MAIKPSLRLAALLLAYHLIVAFVLFATMMPLVAKLVAIVLILLSLLYHLARDALLLASDSWREISFDQGQVSVVTRSGVFFSGLLAGKITVNPYFVLLSVRREGLSLPVFRPIFPDALGADEFRRLCVRMRFIQ